METLEERAVRAHLHERNGSKLEKAATFLDILRRPVNLPENLVREYESWLRTFESHSRFRMEEGTNVVSDVRRRIMRDMNITEDDLDRTHPETGAKISSIVDDAVFRTLGRTTVITDSTAPLCRSYWISFMFCTTPRSQTKFEVSMDPGSHINQGDDDQPRKNKQWRLGACIGPWVNPSEAERIVSNLRSGNRGVQNRLHATIRLGKQHKRMIFAISPAEIENIK